MNGMLFDIVAGTDLDESDSGECVHPPEHQFMNRNLFTGAFDVVCQDCGATIAQNYQR